MTNADSNSEHVTTIAIRVDASTRIGSGHVMRCLTLAKKLKENGIKVTFLSKQHQGNLNQFIQQSGFDLIELSAPKHNIENQIDEKLWLGCSIQDDLKECYKALEQLTISLLIVDHYSLDYNWQQQIRATLHLEKIMVIDDLANRKHDCDILLDQTLGRKACDYKNRVPSHCQLMLGSEYIMLRDEFLQSRELAKDKREQTSEINNILITMGGTDPDNIAEQLLIWLIKFKNSQLNNKAIHVTLVANQTSPFIKNLQTISANNSWITIVSNPKSMANLMLEADIAIGSSGATAWERCCLGLPSLSIISADNQRFLSEKLTKSGAVISLGHFNKLSDEVLTKSLNEIMYKKTTYQTMVNQCFACCDGLGVKKVTDTLLTDFSDNIFLEEANYGDCQDIFNWQSNEDIRKYSHNPKPVIWQEHCDWMKNTIENTNRHLYMIKITSPIGQNKESVGLLRLDMIEKSTHEIDANWLISILIAPEHQGKKIAYQAINKIPQTYKEQGIIAEVHKKNIASHQLFVKTGFTAISSNKYCLKIGKS